MFLDWQENKYILLSHMCKMKQPINVHLAKKEYLLPSSIAHTSQIVY